MDTPFAIATNVEKETGNNYRIDIEIIVPVTLEKFRLDLNELVDQPHQIGGFPPSGEWGNVVVTTRGLPRLKPGDESSRGRARVNATVFRCSSVRNSKFLLPVRWLDLPAPASIP